MLIRFSELLSSSTETVAIRVCGAQFTVHKALLCHYSSYYRAALNGPFKESREGLEPVEYLSKEIYGTFIAWLHSGTVPAGPPTRSSLADLIRLYIYADEYDIPAFRQTIIVQLYDLLEPCRHSGTPRSGVRSILLPTNPVVEFICERLPSNSPLYRLIVEAFACYWHPRMDLCFSGPRREQTPPNSNSSSPSRPAGQLSLPSFSPSSQPAQPYHAQQAQATQGRDSLQPWFLVSVMARQAQLREEPKMRCQFGCPPGYRIRLSSFLELESSKPSLPTTPACVSRADSPLAQCSPARSP